MQTLIDGPLEETRRCADESAQDASSRPTLDELEQNYRRTRARLLDAQQEKMEAAAEFTAARAALSHILEAIWPDSSEHG